MTSRWSYLTCIALAAGTTGFLAGFLVIRAPAPVSESTRRPATETADRQPMPAHFPGKESSGLGDAGYADDLMYFPETVLADAEALAPEDSLSRFPHSAEPGFLPQPSSTATPLTPIPVRSSGLEQLIDAEFSGLSDQQREVWLEVLGGLPLEDAAGILRIWKQFGRGAGRNSVPLLPENPNPGGPGLPADSSHSFQLAAHKMASVVRRMRELIVLNLLNAETHGFRRYESLLLDAPLQAAETTTSTPELTSTEASVSHPQFVAVDGWRIDQRPGTTQLTGNSMDVAISGAGFFVVALEETILYTRCGRFRTDEQRRLVLDHTRPTAVLQPPIIVPSDADEILIEPAGTVYAVRNGQSRQEIGRLELATFRDPGRLQPVGRTLFKATDRSGPALRHTPDSAETGWLEQRALESSNVNFEEELSRLEWLDRMLRSIESGDTSSP